MSLVIPTLSSGHMFNYLVFRCACCQGACNLCAATNLQKLIVRIYLSSGDK
jgi:hypothetical protein